MGCLSLGFWEEVCILIGNDEAMIKAWARCAYDVADAMLKAR